MGSLRLLCSFSISLMCVFEFDVIGIGVWYI